MILPSEKPSQYGEERGDQERSIDQLAVKLLASKSENGSEEGAGIAIKSTEECIGRLTIRSSVTPLLKGLIFTMVSALAF